MKSLLAPFLIRRAVNYGKVRSQILVSPLRDWECAEAISKKL